MILEGDDEDTAMISSCLSALGLADKITQSTVNRATEQIKKSSE
jgi:predicted transcriptional regulator